jgi:hypothetical protein
MGKENSREKAQKAHKSNVFALLALFRGYFIVFPPGGSHVFGLWS